MQSFPLFYEEINSPLALLLFLVGFVRTSGHSLPLERAVSLSSGSAQAGGGVGVDFILPGDVCNCLETFFIDTSGLGHVLWLLVSRDQGCSGTAHNTQAASCDTELSRPKGQ